MGLGDESADEPGDEAYACRAARGLKPAGHALGRVISPPRSRSGEQHQHQGHDERRERAPETQEDMPAMARVGSPLRVLAAAAQIAAVDRIHQRLALGGKEAHAQFPEVLGAYDLVTPSSFSSNFSPTQMIGLKPFCRTLRTFLLTVSSVSPKY